MRVFVVGPGRCGSFTFYKACEAFDNYTTTHEAKAQEAPPWHYPDNHIEVDSRLSFHVPMLLRQYPEALWVVLDRDREAVARSWVRNRVTQHAWRRVTMSAPPIIPGAPIPPSLTGCRHYVEYVYSSLQAFLFNRNDPDSAVSQGRAMWMDACPVQPWDWREFVHWIKATGDTEAAFATLQTVHNAGRPKPSRPQTSSEHSGESSAPPDDPASQRTSLNR